MTLDSRTFRYIFSKSGQNQNYSINSFKKCINMLMSQCIQTNERNELKGRIMNEGGTSQETVRVIQK